jgi:glycosyltransferase involved in cell wall biosynthesis
MKKLLILGIPFDYQKGGAEYQYKILEKHLKEKFEIYYLFRYPKSLNKKRYLNYDYRFRKRYNPNLYTDAPLIYRLIKRLSPDIIYKRGVNYIAAIGVHYAKLHKINMILHIAHQENVEKLKHQLKIKTIFEFLNQKIASYVIRNASKIICQAQYQNMLLEKNYGRSCNLFLPNFHPLPESSIKKKPPIKIVWVANFKQWKQPEIFIKLAEEFEFNQETKFIMIGRPATGTWQRKVFGKMKRLSNLEYKGEISIDEVNEVLCKSHIFVNTSTYEGFPNTYIQAWMREVPVVTLNCDPDNSIKLNKIGFHSKTFQKMVWDIKYLIKNQDKMEEMGIRAKNFACKTFSTANIEKFINLIDDISN